MMRTSVPSCPDLEQETQFSLVEGGGVVMEEEGEQETNSLTSDLYCLDRNMVWYCSSAIARYLVNPHSQRSFSSLAGRNTQTEETSRSLLIWISMLMEVFYSLLIISSKY